MDAQRPTSQRIVGPIIHYLLPIAHREHGRLDGLRHRGAWSAIATFGAIADLVGVNAALGQPVGQIHMFIGAMIMGPLAAWTMKRLDPIWEGKIKAGFEMLVNKFSAGIWGFVMAIAGSTRSPGS